MTDLWPALILSLRIALLATLLTSLVGIPLAFGLARRRFSGRNLLETLIVVPLVLPPTVVGYLLIIVFGRRGWVGHWLDEWFGYSLIFNWHGAVLAAAVVSLPLLFLPARAAFASVDRELEDVARLLGANHLQVFWHVSLPLARRGILAGLLLAFARALGEFGATVMVLGDIQRYQTLPISIYNDYLTPGGLGRAAGAVILLTAVSLAIILLHNRLPLTRQE